jgi:DMSO reductase family type II enzyme molybdopterin subunit
MDAYREQWSWDDVRWGTHCVDCYPGNCPMHVFVKDGKVMREEQAGTFPVIEQGVPDYNPMGCQKGAAWSQTLYGQERVLHPLRRVGERGEGKWEEVSWDVALTDVADGLLDAIEEVGPESIITVMGAEGGTWTGFGHGRLMEMLGGLTTDVNAEINDFSPGIYLTFGKFNLCSSLDDGFHTELLLIFGANPAYTVIATSHYTIESRYQGTEAILFAPDCNPSHIQVDYYFPVAPGTDAAWALGASQVIIEEKLYNERFVKEQTDLPLLVRLDTKRFLRESDLEEDGSDEGFYAWDTARGRIAPAPKATLRWGRVKPALEGRHQVRLKDGSRVTVTPMFELLREHLNRNYTPEKASKICGMNAEAIRTLGRKVAKKRTLAWAGGTSTKYYHSDLMVRSVILLLGLTGNWGRKGTGIGCWSVGLFDGPAIMGQKGRPGRASARQALRRYADALQMFKSLDPTWTDEMAGIEMAHTMTKVGSMSMIPPAFFWYYHCGYRERWNNAAWSDPAMKRPFDEYFQEALDKGWWEGVVRPGPDTPPRVLFQSGGNTLRRVRGGGTQLLRHLWPQLSKVVTLDWRMSTTARFSDIVLPVTNQYETPKFHLPTPHMLLLIYSEPAAKPAGESKSEWEISLLLAKKLEQRAKARDMVEYKDGRGNPRQLKGLYDALTLGGAIVTEEQAAREMVLDSVETGALPADTTLKTLERDGFRRFTDWGTSVLAKNQAGDIKPDETFAHSTWHTQKKLPYPTLTRRAQFYIEHPWFLEAGEGLPTHKENPKMGGDYPFALTSGHNRWSIHSMNITNRMLLQTHRGRPHLVMSPVDAEGRGIVDGKRCGCTTTQGSFWCR